jgi:hypothetical protein
MCTSKTSERTDYKEHRRPHLYISLSDICSHRRPSPLVSRLVFANPEGHLLALIVGHPRAREME